MTRTASGSRFLDCFNFYIDIWSHFFYCAQDLFFHKTLKNQLSDLFFLFLTQSITRSIDHLVLKKESHLQATLLQQPLHELPVGLRDDGRGQIGQFGLSQVLAQGASLLHVPLESQSAASVTFHITIISLSKYILLISEWDIHNDRRHRH